MALIRKRRILTSSCVQIRKFCVWIWNSQLYYQEFRRKESKFTPCSSCHRVSGTKRISSFRVPLRSQGRREPTIYKNGSNPNGRNNLQYFVWILQLLRVSNLLHERSAHEGLLLEAMSAHSLPQKDAAWD